MSRGHESVGLLDSDTVRGVFRTMKAREVQQQLGRTVPKGYYGSLRHRMVGWLMEVCADLRLSDYTLYQTIDLMDRVFSLEVINGREKRDHFQTVALVCLVISSKYHEDFSVVPKMKALQALTCYPKSVDDLRRAERELLEFFDYRLEMLTPLSFIQCFLHFSRGDTTADHAVAKVTRKALRCVACDGHFRIYRASELCAAAMVVARDRLRKDYAKFATLLPVSDEVLRLHTSTELIRRVTAAYNKNLERVARESQVKASQRHAAEAAAAVIIAKPVRRLPTPPDDPSPARQATEA